MATINNSDLTKEIVQGAKIAIAYEAVPSQLAEKVVPVMEVNPRLLRRVNLFGDGTITDSVLATVYTAQAKKETYLTGAYMTYAKDVNSTSLKTQLTAVVNGVEINLLQMRHEPLTAGQGTIAVSFSVPILIDKLELVRLRTSTNVASFDATAGVYGYVVDNSNV